ncbi:MAG: hypothetical protein ACR2QE_18725 [Acidimicrobiales bacterium]
MLIVVAVLVVAVIVALIARRRRPDAPARTGYSIPDQLDRSDFDRPDAPWLIAVFSSATCATCAETWDKARHLESDNVAVQEIEVSAHPDLHDRYAIDAVPLVVVVDHAGVRQASFLGPPKTADLWAAVADLRAD